MRHLIIEPLPPKNRLLELLATLTPIEEAFPDVEDMPPTDEPIFCHL
jgi:hypothetical protein